MADVVKKIEITAALTPDYAAAFKSAGEIARSTSAELKALTQREAGIQKLLALDAQRAAAAQAGNQKEVRKSEAEYAKLSQKLGLTGKSAKELTQELKSLGARSADIEKINKAASKRAELGRLAQEVQRTQRAYEKFKDPALLKHLNETRRRFVELGGALPRESQVRALNGLGARLSQIPGPVGSLASSFGGLKSMLAGPAGGAALVAGVAAAAEKAAKKLFELGIEASNSGDHIIKTADALGITTDAYQELSYAMQRGGASEEGFANALKTLQSQMGAAIQGQTRAIKAFKQFGVTMDEIKTMNAEEMFYRVADGIAAMPDPAQRMRASLQLLGGEGEKVAAAMSGGAKSLDELREAGRKSGNVRTRKELEQAAEAADRMLDSQMALKGALNDVAYAVMPSVISLLQDFSRWMVDNKGAVETFAIAAAGFMGGVVSAVDGVVAAVNIMGAGFEFWQNAFADGIAFIVDTSKTIWNFFTEDLPEAARIAGTAIGNAFRAAGAAIADAFSAAFEWLTERLNGIIQTYREVKAWITGDDSPVTLPGAGGSPQVTVNMNIDARGGDSSTAQGVKRAIDQTSGTAAASMAGALNRWTPLAQAGGAA